MTSGVDVVYDLLNVAHVGGGAWDNYGEKPDVKRVGMDDLFGMEQGEIGVKTANIGILEKIKDACGKVLINRWEVGITVSHGSKDDRDNIYQDVKDLFENTSVTVGDEMDIEDLGSESGVVSMYRYTFSVEVLVAGSVV